MVMRVNDGNVRVNRLFDNLIQPFCPSLTCRLLRGQAKKSRVYSIRCKCDASSTYVGLGGGKHRIRAKNQIAVVELAQEVNVPIYFKK